MKLHQIQNSNLTTVIEQNCRMLNKNIEKSVKYNQFANRCILTHTNFQCLYDPLLVMQIFFSKIMHFIGINVTSVRQTMNVISYNISLLHKLIHIHSVASKVVLQRLNPEINVPIMPPSECFIFILGTARCIKRWDLK